MARRQQNVISIVAVTRRATAEGHRESDEPFVGGTVEGEGRANRDKLLCARARGGNTVLQ